ncbi:MAG TPA: phosphoribosylglycinamide formyltransferase [Flavobacterium sp.]|jgi:phosphoribosylglycinamide formyltransferase-1
MKNVVLFASGAGSNAENIILYFMDSTEIKVAAVFTNNPKAGVIEKAQKHSVPVFIFDKEELLDGSVNAKLCAFEPALIVLAGFLLMLPLNIIKSFPNKIINIHPALLPKYGGKGMYGLNVHRAVLEKKEQETGISIHYVDEHYDNGDLIFQSRVPISECRSAEEIAAKVHELEHRHYPEVIENLLKPR